MTMKHPPLTAISESVGEALSAGSGIVHDLGSTAAEKLPELPDTVNRLAHRAQRRFRPAKKRSPLRPALIIAAVLVACVAVIAWRRRAATSDELVQHAPPREYTERATAAAGGR
jgi:mitochondrial fission protein ELM1